MSKENSRRESSWSWRIRLLGTSLSVILLAWLLIEQDWSSILGAVGELALWQVLLSILLIALRHVFNALRWFILVHTQEIPLNYMEALRLVFSGLFASNFLPSMVGGDVVRIAGVLQRTEKRVAGASSVVVDRLVGAAAMLAALPFSVPLVSSFLSSGIFIGALTFGFGSSVMHTIRLAFSRVLDALKLWANQPRRLALALLANWASMLVNFIAIWILAVGLGMKITLPQVVGASAITYYLTIIPLSINGYGIRELAVVALYTQLGTTPEQASALALLSRSIFMLVSLVGVVWLGNLLDYRQVGLEEDLG